MEIALQKKILELHTLCENRDKIYYTDFFVPYDNIKLYNGILNGGYQESQRMIYFALPKYISKEKFDVSNYLSAIKITPTDKKVYSHRDYLGSIMSLQIKREKVGDIIVFETHAYVVAFHSLIEFLFDNLKSISRANVEVEIVPLSDLVQNQNNIEKVVVSVASARLDSIICAVHNLSREKGRELIEKGQVKINRLVVLKCEKNVVPKDSIIVFGIGKFDIADSCGQSKKGKERIEINKYI